MQKNAIIYARKMKCTKSYTTNTIDFIERVYGKIEITARMLLAQINSQVTKIYMQTFDSLLKYIYI